MPRTPKAPADIENYAHDDKRRMIPTAEQQGFVEEDETRPKTLVYPRDTTLDPQLVWRGKDAEDQSDLYVDAPPIYIQEKIHPRAIIERLKRDTVAREAEAEEQVDLFADFNGRPEELEARTEFYAHDQNWQNRLILGDALMVMASLAERESLRGKVQCIYMDPPYGIKFNSNWQTRTNIRDVKDGAADHVSREPEVIRAFRDTWKDGVNTYLSYLRDRLVLARDLLTESGSIFVQIGDENVHLVRSLLDEVFGAANFVALITVQKTGGQPSALLPLTTDYVLWFAKALENLKYRQIFLPKVQGEGAGSGARYSQVDDEGRLMQTTSLTSSRPPGSFDVPFHGRTFRPGKNFWKTSATGFSRLKRSSRLESGPKTLRYRRYLEDFPAYQLTNLWNDVAGSGDKI